MKLHRVLVAALAAAAISVPAIATGASSSRANETTVSPAAFKTISTLQRELVKTKRLLAHEQTALRKVRASLTRTRGELATARRDLAAASARAVAADQLQAEVGSLKGTVAEGLDLLGQAKTSLQNLLIENSQLRSGLQSGVQNAVAMMTPSEVFNTVLPVIRNLLSVGGREWDASFYASGNYRSYTFNWYGG